MRLQEFTSNITSFNNSLMKAEEALKEVKKEYKIYKDKTKNPIKFYEFASKWLELNEDKI